MHTACDPDVVVGVFYPGMFFCAVLTQQQFLAVVRKHIRQDELYISPSCGSGGGKHGLEGSDMAGKVGEVFKQMDVRGDGDVSWEDFSAVRHRTPFPVHIPPSPPTHGTYMWQTLAG